MITQTRYTKDSEGRTIQVAISMLNDHWEPLCYGYQEVGPFDDAVEIEAALMAQQRTRAHVVLSQQPLDMDHTTQDPLPFE